MPKRILYIEDNANNRLLVERIIKAEGYIMLEATDGLSGIEMAARERPDLFIVDLHLPGVSGFTVIRKIKANPEISHTPIVVLTAYGNAASEQEAREAGCDGFLHKPADIRQIRAVIRHFLGEPEVHGTASL